MFNVTIFRKSFHSDIHLISLLNRYGVILDSYHFANDRSDQYSHLHGYQKVYEILIDIFIAWKEIVEKENGFLALDFADEYLGGLFVCNQNEKIELTYGYCTQLNGWELDIISIVNGHYLKENFVIDKNFRPISIGKNELIKYIDDTLIVPMRRQIIYEQVPFEKVP